VSYLNRVKNVFIGYGQKSNCMYYYLITENSIEEKIFETLKQRKNYTDELFRKDDEEWKN